MQGKPPVATYLGVDLEIWCAIPKSWPLKKQAWALAGKLYPTHCDADNQQKAILDGMNEVVYADDRFVNEIIARRKYAREDKAIVRVRLLLSETSQP